MLPTKPVCKKIIFLYFHESSIIAQYSCSVWINHAAGAVSVCMCVLRCSPGAPVVWGPSPSLCLINQSCTGLQAAGLRCPQEQMCTEPPSLSLSPEQVSSARPCSEGLLRVACVCGCNWLATVTTEAQETLPMPQRDWSVYEVASAGQGAIWTSWHLATLSVPYRAVRLREREDSRCNLYTRAHTQVSRSPKALLWPAQAHAGAMTHVHQTEEQVLDQKGRPHVLKNRPLCSFTNTRHWGRREKRYIHEPLFHPGVSSAVCRADITLSHTNWCQIPHWGFLISLGRLSSRWRPLMADLRFQFMSFTTSQSLGKLICSWED